MTRSYDQHFKVVTQGQELLKRTFPLHTALIYIAQFKGLVPSATEQPAWQEMIWKIVQFATPAVSYRGKSSLPSPCFTPFTSYHHRFRGLPLIHITSNATWLKKVLEAKSIKFYMGVGHQKFSMINHQDAILCESLAFFCR